MVARLRARAWASLRMVAARSSRLQRVAGWSCASVLVVARLTTWSRSSGGKAPGAAGAGGVAEAAQAVGGEALAPLADGVAVAVEFGGDGLVGGPVRGRGPEDEAAAQGQGLGGGAGPDQGFELLAGLRGEHEG